MLPTFLSLYPKEEEIQHLRSKIQQLGVYNFKEALRKLDCGKVEEFALQLLTYKSDLKKKAYILNTIIEQGPLTNKLIEHINSWDVVKEHMVSNQFFQQIVHITHQVLTVMKEQKHKGFDLLTLHKVFDVKSVYTNDKCTYYFVMKEWLRSMHS